MKIILSFLWVVLVTVAGTKATVFDGLPLNSTEAVIFLIGLAIIWWGNWENNRLSKALSLILVATSLWQMVGSYTLPYGWGVCTKRQLAQESLETPCEPSAEFRHGKLTETRRDINFHGRHFPVYFMNELAFNFYPENPDQPDRASLPYQLSLNGYIKPSMWTNLFVTSSVDETVLMINGETKELKIGAENRFALGPDTIHNISLAYTTNRSDYDIFKASLGNEPVYYQNSTPSRIWLGLYRLIHIGLLTLIGLIMLNQCWQTIKTLSRPLKYVTGIGSLWLLTDLFFLHNNIWVSAAMLVILGLIYTFGLNKTNGRALLLVIALFTIGNAYTLTQSYDINDKFMLYTGGSDYLTHEAFSRAVFTAADIPAAINGGEGGPFYYQPLARYGLGALHKTFGDSTWGPVFVQTILVTMVTIGAMGLLKMIGGVLATIVFGGLFIGLVANPSTSILEVANSPLQQALGFPLLLGSIILTLGLWYAKRHNLHWDIILALLWSATIMTRFDYLPIMLVYFTYLGVMFWNRRDMKTILTALACLTVFPIFVATRNYIVAKEFSFVPNSGIVNLIKPFYPIFDYQGQFQPSDLSGGKMFVQILIYYKDNLSELIRLLWNNFSQDYITGNWLKQIVWYSLLPLTLVWILIGQKKAKVLITLSLLMGLFALTFTSSFFVFHNGAAAFSHLDFLAAFLVALLFGLIIGSYRLNRRPGEKTERRF